MKLTNLLIILCAGFSLYAWGNPSNNLAFSYYAVLNGSFYTLFTSIFVHADPVHLIGNILFLYLFGQILEDEVGSLRMGTAFFTGGILSFVLSVPFYPNSNMLGASAAIFCVMAAVLLVRSPTISARFLSPAGPLVLLFFIFNIFSLPYQNESNVAYISHIIGFVVGLFFGASWNNEWKKSLLFTLVLLIIYIVLYNYLKMLLS